MERYVAFLRAVNVGKRRVAMARLREEFEALGYDDVWTYINSGNVVFSTSLAHGRGAGDRASGLAATIEARLEKAFGFDVATLLRTADQVEEIAGRKPFGDVGDGDTHMVVLLREPLSAPTKKAAEALSNDSDQLVVRKTEVHWLIRGKLMDSSLTPKDWRVLGDQPSTNRNSTMLTKLADKLHG